MEEMTALTDLKASASVRQVTIRPGKLDVDPVGHARRQTRLFRTLGLLTPICFAALWELGASQGFIDTRFFPAPSMIARSGADMIQDGTLLNDVWMSTRRIVLGFALGVSVGVGLGILLGCFSVIRAALEPMFSAFYTIPKLALLPLLLLVFGLGELPKVLLVGLGVFFIMWISTLEAIVGVPAGYLEAAKAFGARGWTMFRHVTFPAILPSIFVGMRIAIGNAVLVLIGIEFVQSSDGIGYRIWHSWSLFAAQPMYVGIVTVALMGFAFTTLIKLAGRSVIRWDPSSK